MGVSLRSPRRNLGNESNYRYGITEGFTRVAEVLNDFGGPVTWTAAALALERAPWVAEFIRGRTDEVASHGYRWVHQFRMSEAEEREFIRQAVKSITETVGTRPVGHLSRYLFTERTRYILASEGFLYHMDDYSSDVPYWDGAGPHPIVVVPYAIDTNDMKMWAEPSYTPRQWLEYAIDTFDRLYLEGAHRPRMMSLGVHLRVIGRPGRIGALEQFLRHVESQRQVWIATRREIAQHFASNVAPPAAAS
jgi:peptidoglycan/xylan/chitin deacetylase (PgdA/CDA1 family)